MKRIQLFVYIAALFVFPVQAQTPNAWINEIHYDDTGGGSDFIEIVVEDAGAIDLSRLDVELYRDDGTRYGSIGDVDADFGVESTADGFTVYTWETTLQNGPSDGLALCYDDVPLQVISYEGTFLGAEDCANGAASTDIGVAEDGSNANTTSLQLEGAGLSYTDFAWTGPITNTRGSLNAGQSLESSQGGNCNSIAELKTFFETDEVVKYEWNEEANSFALAEGSFGDIIEIVDVQYKLDDDTTPDYGEPIATTWSITEGAAAYAVSGIAVKQGQTCPDEKDLVKYDGDPVTAGGTIKVEDTAISYIAFGVVPLENECKSTIIASLGNSTGEVIFNNTTGITELYFHTPDADGLPDPDEPAIDGLLVDNVTGLTEVSDPAFDYYYATDGTDPSEVTVTFKDDPATDDPQRFFLIAYSNGTTREQEANPDNTAPICKTIIDPPFPVNQVASRLAVESSYPNPFRESTTIRFTLPKPMDVDLTVYNVMGQKVARLVQGQMPQGPHAVDWDGRSDSGKTLASGLYFYHLTAGNITETQRITLVR